MRLVPEVVVVAGASTTVLLAWAWRRTARIGRAGVALLLGCSASAVALLFVVGTEEPTPEESIRGAIAGIREAILAGDPEGIVAPGTDDWTFTRADGTTRDRATWLADARALFAGPMRVVSLESTIESIAPSPEGRTVMLVQELVREAGDPPVRTRTRYREQQAWVLDAGAWKVRSVRIVGAAESLPP